MKFRIKENSYRVLKLLPGIILVGLTFLIVLKEASRTSDTISLIDSPAALAWGVKIVEGIHEFYGEPREKTFIMQVELQSIFYFSFYCIILPSLLLYILNFWYKNSKTIDYNHKAGLFTTIIFLSLFIFTVPVLIQQVNNNLKLREKYAYKNPIDIMYNTLEAISFDILEDAASDTVGSDREKLLKAARHNLGLQSNPGRQLHFSEGLSIKYKIRIEPAYSDTSIKIYLVGDIPGIKSKFINIDGRRGKMQVSAIIPLSINARDIEKEN